MRPRLSWRTEAARSVTSVSALSRELPSRTLIRGGSFICGTCMFHDVLLQCETVPTETGDGRNGELAGACTD